MQAHLKPEAQAYLQSQVAAGHFASVEDAIDALVHDDQAFQSGVGAADLSWAKSFIAPGLADLGHSEQ